MNRMRKRLLFAGAVITSTLGAAAASAQDATTNIDEVVVTGTRIKRADISGVGPATVITEEQIANTGITNLENLLQRLPASAGNAGGADQRLLDRQRLRHRTG